MNNRKFLFGITATDVIVRDDYNNAVVNDVMSHLNGIRRIVMTCYRAGGALTELIIDFGEAQTFCLTIGEGSLDVAPLPQTISGWHISRYRCLTSPILSFLRQH